MNRYTLSSRLTRIQEEIPKLSNTIDAMRITDTEVYGKNYEELSMDAALRAERIACSLRNLIFAANLLEKPLLMEKTAEVHGITIRHKADRVEITLPGLLPKRTFFADLIMLCLMHPVSSLPSVTPFWMSNPLQDKIILSTLYCSMLSAAFTPRNDMESPFSMPPVEIMSHSERSDNSSKFSMELVITVSFFLFLIFFAINTAVVEASRKICSPS